MQARPQQGLAAPLAGLRIFFSAGDEGLAGDLALGLESAAPQAFDPAPVAAALRAGDRVVVLWRGLDQVLADSLAADGAIADAIAAWQRDAGVLLNLFRQNRRQVILARADSLHHDSAALTERLGRAGIAVSAPPQVVVPIARALALLAAGQDSGLARLLDELLAASLPAPDPSVTDILQGVAVQTAEGRRAMALMEGRLAESEREAAALGEETARLVAGQHAADMAAADLRSALEGAETAKIVVDTALGAALHEAELLRSHVELIEESLSRQRPIAQAEAEAAALTIATLQAQLTLQDQTAADLAVRIGEREAEAELLRQQVGQAAELLAQQKEVAQSGAKTAASRIAGLEEKIAASDKAAAGLAARLARGEAEADLLRAQIGLLQDNLTEILTAGSAASEAAVQPEAAKAPAPMLEEHARTLARALAAARTEAVLRAGLEKELAALKARQQDRAAKDDELAHSKRIVAQMAKEGVASLDQIARLSQAHKAAAAERDALSAELAQLRSVAG